MPVDFSEAVGIALTGMTVAFLSLGVIALLITAIGWLDRRDQRRADTGSQTRSTTSLPAAGPKQAPTVDDLTLVLITAAVTVVLQGRGRVRRIRPIGPSGSDWAMQARVTVQGSHVVTGHFRSRGKT